MNIVSVTGDMPKFSETQKAVTEYVETMPYFVINL